MNGEKKKVLIVDDEPDAVAFLSNWLEDNGYAFCAASDGEQGMRVIMQEYPDLILMDLRMPRHTGFQLYRELRSSKNLRRIPVFFVTGLTASQIFGEGCDPLPEPEAFIEKPIDLKALREAIERVLSAGHEPSS